MSLNSVAASFRSSVLRHLRLPGHASTLPAVGSLLPRLGDVLVRGFSSGFLDKGVVTERVLHVTKHFEKIDAAKARAGGHALSASLCQCQDPVSSPFLG